MKFSPCNEIVALVKVDSLNVRGRRFVNRFKAHAANNSVVHIFRPRASPVERVLRGRLCSVSATLNFSPPIETGVVQRQIVLLRKSKKIISDGAIDFFERDNPNVLAYYRRLGEEELIVLCNFCSVESMLTEKTLAQYSAQGYKKILGNYDELVENFRPFEVVVLEK